MEYAAKQLKYKSLEGLSEKQLAEHHDVLYAGYVKKINEIRAKLQTVDKSATNATYSDLRESRGNVRIEWSQAARVVFRQSGRKEPATHGSDR